MPVHMPPRERLVACLVANGQTVTEISLQTHIAPATIYSYIAHARRRYVDAGRPAPSKIALRARLIEDGYLASDTSAKLARMTYRPVRWSAIEPGDSVRLRPKRIAGGPRVETSVVQLLERHLADGLGFVDNAGNTYRQYYYELEVLT